MMNIQIYKSKKKFSILEIAIIVTDKQAVFYIYYSFCNIHQKCTITKRAHPTLQKLVLCDNPMSHQVEGEQAVGPGHCLICRLHEQ